MRSATLSGRFTWRVAVFVYATLLTCFHMAMAEPWRLASFQALATFQAAEPFQHRILLPAIVAGIQALLPLGAQLLFAVCELIAWIVLLGLGQRLLTTLEIASTAASRRLLAFSLTIPIAVHLILPDLVLSPPLVIKAGVLELGTVRAQTLFYYVYDLPAAVFTLALATLILEYARTRNSNWLTAYLVLFAVATLNRETTIFIVPAFAAALYSRLDRWRLATAVIAQIVIFAVIQATLQWLFADNINPNASVPGTPYENHLLANLALFLNPLYLLTFVSRFCAGFHFPALLLWRHVDRTLARVLLWYALPFAASVLFFARIQEQRVFIELVPLVWLCGVQAVAVSWGRRGAGAQPPSL